MHRLIALVAALLLTFFILGPTLAVGAPDTLWSDDTPPARFQGEAMATVLYLDPARLQDVCGSAVGQVPAGMRILACTYRGESGTWTTVLPNPCPAAAYGGFAQIACHEKGHTLGWTAMHER